MRIHIVLLAVALCVSCSDACNRLGEMVKPEDEPPRAIESTDVLLSQEANFLPQSARGNGIAMDNYTLVVTAGENLTVTATSAAFDPVLHVTPPENTGTLINDDFEGDRTRSQLTLVTTHAGVLKVAVTSYQPNAQGTYRVEVRRNQDRTEGQNPPSAAAALLTIGESRQGQLDVSDARLPDGRRYEVMPVAGSEAGTSLELSITPGAPSLTTVLFDPAGTEVVRMNPVGPYRITSPGNHRLQLMSSTGDAVVNYHVSLIRSQPAVTTPQLARDHHRLPTAGEPQPLALDSATHGVLTDGDVDLPSGELADLYHLQVPAGNPPIHFELVSATFDPYLMVVGPAGNHWENDDAGGSTNSAMDLTATAPGIYRVIVTSYQAHERGSYDLKVSSARIDAGLVNVPPVPSAPTATFATTVRRSGALQTGDTQLQSGEYADSYPFTWDPGARLRISLTSAAFDTFLIVRAPNGLQEENDDIESQNTNSALTFSVGQAGPHTVIVTSYRSGETGPYELVVEPANGSDAPVPPSEPPPSPVGSQVLDGTLGPGDAQLQSGEWVDTHDMTFAAGEPIRIEARSTAFDTYLIVRPPEGQQQDNDDGPDGTNARVDMVASESGTYQVLVTSYRPGEQGGYQLVVSRNQPGELPSGTSPSGTLPSGEPPPVPAPTPAPAPDTDQPSSPTSPIRGTLVAGDETLQGGEYVDQHTLRFQPGQSIQIRLTSDQFDPYLIVRSPSGRQEDNDDLDSSTRNAGVDIPATEAGPYTILVTSYRPGETGAYVLSTSEGQSIPSPGGQGGQVYGLFVGISDYPDGVGDLPECANDAVKLAETLRNANLLAAERQVLLTDQQATVANLRSRLQWLTSQLRPDDVFVFFFSGHGGQTDSSSDSREIDGTDEFLVLHDGHLLDDEVGRLFDAIPSRVSLVNIDACFSGGFAKDIITRPGRVGMFSSEEDVVSAVASQFQAGGYLSHFLRVGMSGAADGDPTDRVLTVGELTHYVYTQFGAHATDVHRASSYQHLVVDRGAVGVSTVLWSYR